MSASLLYHLPAQAVSGWRNINADSCINKNPYTILVYRGGKSCPNSNFWAFFDTFLKVMGVFCPNLFFVWAVMGGEIILDGLNGRDQYRKGRILPQPFFCPVLLFLSSTTGGNVKCEYTFLHTWCFSIIHYTTAKISKYVEAKYGRGLRR